MKKLIALLLSVFLLLGLCACGENGSTASGKSPEGFLVGYGRADITPTGAISMGDRVSTGIMTWLNADAIAITGTDGNSAMIITIDVGSLSQNLAMEIRSQISKAHGIPVEAVFVSATHTHSDPDINAAGHSKRVVDGAVESAKLAMENRAPAEMQIATVKTKNLNFVRNYLMDDGTYAGTNFGDPDPSRIVDHESEVDADLQLIKFVRNGATTADGAQAKDIIIANFQGHPHRDYNLTQYFTLISANVPYFFREELAEKLDCHVAYFSGASGNVNMNSRIPEENVTVDMKDQGRKLAQYALQAEGKYTAVSGTTVHYEQMDAILTVDHSRDHLASIAAETQNIANTQGTSAANEFAKANGLYHYLEARAIISKAGKDETMEVDIGALSVGDVAFVAAPYEIYDTNGMNIKKGSPFKMTFVLYLCNGAYSYIPSDECYDHGGYGVYSCRYVRGTGEQLQNYYLEMLNKLHAKY